MSLVYYLCYIHSGKYVTFEEGYSIEFEQLGNLHQFIKNGASLEEVLELVGELCAIFDICSFIV